ncbi:MAG TPA: peptidylprolyl isomerase [Kofleriaceae bacterium]|nr:peptidylprolyl isomerase [Kofleriaceae bacterium]
MKSVTSEPASVKSVRQPDVMAAVLLAVVAGTACQPSKHGSTLVAPANRALRVEIAQAESQREQGVARLLALRNELHGAERWLAVRGLGRIGTATARAALRSDLQSLDPSVVAQAASALGVVAALEQIPDDESQVISDELVRSLAAVADQLPPVLEALGRAGTVSAQPVLIKALQSRDSRTVEIAALALGRYGRRKLLLRADAVDALVSSSSHSERDVRYAATYALARQVVPPKTDGAVVAPEIRATVLALTARLSDADAEIRAVAAGGLGRRLAWVPATPALVAAIADPDWRVAIEVIRSLAEPNAVDVARAMLQQLAELPLHNDVYKSHLIGAALESLPTKNAPAEVVLFATAVTQNAALRGRLQCLAQSLLQLVAATPAFATLTTCGGTAFDAGDRAVIIAEVIKTGGGELAARQAALQTLLASSAPAVAAAGLAVVDGTVAPWSVVNAALRSPAAVVVGAAIEAADRGIEANVAEAPELAATLLARAATEQDPELASSFLSVIGKHKLAGGAAVCANVRAHPVVMATRAECLKAFGASEPANAPAPFVAFAPGLAPWPQAVRWQLETSRGRIDIMIDGELAPWHAAVIRDLTERGFYNGLRFHRFVGNFVVQGGDPTGTGWGGPGFVVPSEVGSLLDGDPQFGVGSVGFADAGKDTGGSQWFVMHSRAPHLEGRYTVIGHLTAGVNTAMQLNVGDTVQRARLLP